MSSRSKARKAALDLLYESDIRKGSATELLSKRVTEMEYEAREFTKELIDGIELNKRKIDELIATYAQGWDMDRMPPIDRNILRIAIFEILWAQDIDLQVACDEAVELAKSLSTDESSSYINGVLGRIIKLKDSIAI